LNYHGSLNAVLNKADGIARNGLNFSEDRA
jgi:hypothetical protein